MPGWEKSILLFYYHLIASDCSWQKLGCKLLLLIIGIFSNKTLWEIHHLYHPLFFLVHHHYAGIVSTNKASTKTLPPRSNLKGNNRMRHLFSTYSPVFSPLQPLKHRQHSPLCITSLFKKNTYPLTVIHRNTE